MATESVTLDGVQLNSLAGTYVLRTIDFPVAAKRYEWVQGADSDGSVLVRDPLFENRTIPISLRVNQQATMDAALAAIATIGGKLEEAENQPDGLPLVWTPAGASKSITFYVLSGEINGIPVTKTGDERGWFRFYPVVNLTLTCKPFGYGTEITGTPASAATPLVTVDVPSVPGDVPAEARIIVTDAASQARRDVIWGLEQLYYTPGSPSSLLLTGTNFVTTGFAGVPTALAGSYGTGNPIMAGLFGTPTAVCGTGNQPHVGTYRVRARIQATDVVSRVRLAWQDGDGPLIANAWASPPLPNQWCEVDLGVITITPAKLGTQRWTGRIEAYTSDGSPQTMYVNLLELIPAGEGYGRARAAYAYRAGAVVAHDEFSGVSYGVLNGRTAPVGGAWATAGATGDYTGRDHGGTAGGTYYRDMIDTAPRFAILGSARTDTDVIAAIYPSGDKHDSGVVARYVDTTNYLAAFLEANYLAGSTSSGWVITTLIVNIVVAGVTTAFVQPVPSLSGKAGGAQRVRLVAYGSGAAYVMLLDFQTGATLASLAVPPQTALATGGALASGQAGLYDMGLAIRTGGASANQRLFDEVAISTPAAEPIALYGGRQLEFRHDATQRQDATGTYYGRPSAYRGARALIPPAGDKNRTSRVVVAARRNDTDTTYDGGVADSTSVQVNVTPRYLAVPH